MNKFRNEIYNEVTGKIEKISLGDKIYSLNVPTGTGKTLTSLSFAFKLREKIKKELDIYQNNFILYHF
jgi:CRISPR-associated endonuclease/helicase Cas3